MNSQVVGLCGAFSAGDDEIHGRCDVNNSEDGVDGIIGVVRGADLVGQPLVRVVDHLVLADAAGCRNRTSGRIDRQLNAHSLEEVKISRMSWPGDIRPFYTNRVSRFNQILTRSSLVKAKRNIVI